MTIAPYSDLRCTTLATASVLPSVRLKDTWWEFGASLVLACGLAWLCHSLVAEARFIPSSSMAPTLAVGDHLLVDKLSYRMTVPKRGDIVVFKPPRAALRTDSMLDPNTPWVKRLVALPGDVVEIRRGILFLNGQPHLEPYLSEPVAYAWHRRVVPKGFVFVLGDNRNHSVDSHVWGMLPEANIIGRASLRFWPPSRLGAVNSPAGGKVVVASHGEGSKVAAWSGIPSR